MRRWSLLVVLVMMANVFALSVPFASDVRAAMLYVGGGGPGNYTTIQAAIDDAGPGDTVFVYSGTYVENVVIGKSISLMGESRDTTIIDAGGVGSPVYITSSYVNISGFTATGSSVGGFEAGIRLEDVHNCNVSMNNVSDNGFGIILHRAHNITLASNTFFHNLDQIALYVSHSMNATVVGNVMSRNGVYVDGDLLGHWNSHTIDTTNTVDGDLVYYWKDVVGGTVPQDAAQVILANCSGWLVEDMYVENTSVAVQLGFSSNNRIANNTAVRNRVGMLVSDSSDNTFTGNNISDNYFGIALTSAWNNTLYGNLFWTNTRQALDSGPNRWDNGYPTGGNYWSDYSGVDQFSDWTQTRPGPDGIGDTPHVIDVPTEDRFPLMIYRLHSSPPDPPIGLAVEGFSAGPGLMHITNRVDPELNWTFVDPDAGDLQFEFEVEVWTGPGGTGTCMWSYSLASPLMTVSYTAATLVRGTSYYYRVRTRDAMLWGNWSELMFHTNTPPPVPDLLWPHNITVVPIDLVLYWMIVIDADGDLVMYEVEVDDDLWFGSPDLVLFTSDNTSGPHNYALLVRYYWQVRAHDGWEYSPWAYEFGPWYFESGDTWPPLLEFLAVDSFYEATPGIMHITNRWDPRLNWTYFSFDPFDQQNAYELEVGEFPGQGNGTIWANSGGAEQEVYYDGPEFNECFDYYFRVRAQDDSPLQIWSQWHEVAFHTNCKPTPPIPISPGQGEILPGGVPISFSLLPSSDSDFDPIQYYIIQVARDPDFNDIVFEFPFDTIPFLVLSPGCYYWRAAASDGWEFSAWSSANMFCIDNQPLPPVGLGVEGYMSGPGLGHILVKEPALNWTFVDVDGDPQTEFHVEVWTGQNGTGLRYWDYSADSSSLTVIYNEGGLAAELIEGLEYYFRVRTRDDYAWSPWSELGFGMSAPPSKPSMVAPGNGEVSVAINPDLSWEPVTDPNGDEVLYLWYVDTEPIPTAGYIANGTTSSTFAAVPVTLDYGTSYYWLVCSDDGWEMPQCSSVWSFLTEFPPNLPPNPPKSLKVGGHSVPPGVAHIVGHSPALAWTFDDPDMDWQGACHVQVWTDTPATGEVIWELNQSWSLELVIYEGPELIDGAEYTFRVKTMDEHGLWGGWSERTFRMNSKPPAPQLLSPADGSVLVPPRDVVLEWQAAIDPDGDSVTYTWYLGASPWGILATGSTETTSVSLGLEPLLTYYWHVEAWDGFEMGVMSVTSTFTAGPISGSVAGTVLRDEDGAPLEGAFVELLDDGGVVRTAMTNGDGGFLFTDVSFGTYSVRAWKSGYEDSTKAGVVVSISDADQSVGELRLEAVEEVDGGTFVILLLVAVIIAAILLLLVVKRRRASEEAEPDDEVPSPEEGDE